MNFDSKVFPETLDFFDFSLYQSVKMLMTSFRDQAEKRVRERGKEQQRMDRGLEKRPWGSSRPLLRKETWEIEIRREMNGWRRKAVRSRPGQKLHLPLCPCCKNSICVGMYVCIYVYVTYSCCLDSVLAQWVSLCLTSRRTYIFSCLATSTDLYTLV